MRKTREEERIYVIGSIMLQKYIQVYAFGPPETAHNNHQWIAIAGVVSGEWVSCWVLGSDKELEMVDKWNPTFPICAPTPPPYNSTYYLSLLLP